MKKSIAVAAFLFVVAVGTAVGQMLNLNEYSKIFLNSGGRLDSQYFRPASREEKSRIAILGGSETNVDTDLEIALLSTCTGVVDIRPVEAKNMLPLKTADDYKKLGLFVLKDIKILGFLGNTKAVGYHEAVLQFDIMNKGNVTRAEVEAFYRDNIRALIASVVDEEFNKIGFRLANSDTHSSLSHTAVLIRSPQNGQYTLNYGGTYTNNETRIITANSIEALLSEMRNGKHKTDFDETGISAVRAQAALIPAVVYADWKAKGIANGVDGMALIKEALTNFFLNPSKDSFNILSGIEARYSVTASALSDPLARAASRSFMNTLSLMNDGLRNKINVDISNGNIRSIARIPNDPRYDVFSTPYK